MSAPEKLTAVERGIGIAAALVRLSYRDAEAMDEVTRDMLREYAVAVREVVDQLSAEIKRLKVHALNDANEISTLRADLQHIRRELDEALGRWT